MREPTGRATGKAAAAGIRGSDLDPTRSPAGVLATACLPTE